MTNSVFGVIDVGSNSVRLLISCRGETIAKFATVTRLSLGMTEDKTLKSDSIKRTIKALSFFKEKVEKEYGVKILYVFATAGVRYAKNKSDFLDAVKNELGLEVDVISGELEAEIGALGALGASDGGFIDVGGKSTEIVQILNGKRVFSVSLEIGVVSLFEKFGQDVDKIRTYCREFLRDNLKIFSPKSKNFVAVGGTATTLASISLGLKEYDFKVVDKYVLDKNSVLDCAQKLSSIPVEERSKFFCVQKGREDVILSGAILFEEIISYFSLGELTVRDSDNLEGYLIKKVGTHD